jgi:hypothetical protein
MGKNALNTSSSVPTAAGASPSSSPANKPDALYCGACGGAFESTFEGDSIHKHRLTCAGCSGVHTIRLRLGADGCGVTEGAAVDVPA